MRPRIALALMVAAGLGAAAGAAVPSQAAAAPPQAPAAAAAEPGFMPVQYYYGPSDWERRQYRRERRHARDQARINEAARREAARIEWERRQRRAARRDYYTYGYRY